MTFEEFCHQQCDGLYDPNLPFELQGNGYRKLRKMLEDKVDPASLAESIRWETNTTNQIPGAKNCQCNVWERVIRDEQELARIEWYIRKNPMI